MYPVVLLFALGFDTATEVSIAIYEEMRTSYLEYAWSVIPVAFRMCGLQVGPLPTTLGPLPPSGGPLDMRVTTTSR